ncbi:MAG TPA: efflux RND transporter periplasmic adaptor subunit [Blastocatellia bacterium]|nr:efflux RND transporter periplasmic adaptor subunit [Blastocatellia bacterium]
MKVPPYIRRHYVILLMVTLLAVSLLMVVRSRSKSNSEAAAAAASAEPAPLAPVTVPTARAVSQQVSAYIQATGSFTANESSDVAPETSGQVVATPVDAGDFVSQGAVIARLDDRDARLRFQQAQAAVRQAAAALRQAQAKLGLGPDGKFTASDIPEVRAARQNYEAAEAQARLAEANERRYANLVETGDVSRAVYDQQRAQAETARAQANAARQQLEVAINAAQQNNAGIGAAQASLEAARAQAALAEKTVSDTVVKAPFSGYIVERPIAVGEYVTPSSRIATLFLNNPIKLLLQLPESDVGRISVGMPVVVTVAAYPDREFEGKLAVIIPAIDPVSRTVTVVAGIDNRSNALRPNMFATGRILQPGGAEGVFVPRSAVASDSSTGSARVYVVQGETARLRVVQVGEQEGDFVRVVSGVSAGDEVVTANLDQLFDGATIQRQ